MLRRLLCALGMHQPIMKERRNYDAYGTGHEVVTTPYYWCARQGCKWNA